MIKQLFFFLLLLISRCESGEIRYQDNPILGSLFTWPIEKPKVKPDNQSMFVNHKQLKEILHKNMNIIVELGSWLGASTRFMLDHAPNAIVIAIDTWKGSLEHFTIPTYAQKIPNLFSTFLVNCWDYKERLIPFQTTTQNGLQNLHQLDIQPDLIYIDASHDYGSVIEDIRKSYTLFPQAIICGDDFEWQPQEKLPYKPVQAAVNDFAQEYNCTIYSNHNFWMLKR